MCVSLDNRDTHVHLTEHGPDADERDVADLEAKLDASLPASYRGFLLQHNGGRPVEGQLREGTNEPGAVREEEFGGTVDLFLSLLPRRYPNSLAEYERLKPGFKPLGIETQALGIATDIAGNVFLMDLSRTPSPILFWDHESDRKIEDCIVVATDFEDFLDRFVTAEEAAATLADEVRREHERMLAAPLPSIIEQRLAGLEDRYPEIRQWVLDAFLAVVADQAFLHLQGDEISRHAFDVVCFVNEESTGEPTTVESLHEDLNGVWRSDRNGPFGSPTGASRFVMDWYRDRVRQGILEERDAGAELSTMGLRAIVKRCARLRQRANRAAPE